MQAEGMTWLRPEESRWLLAEESREVLMAEDLLGFDSVRDAKSAIIAHEDWEDRWEVSDDWNRNILREWRQNVIASRQTD